MRSAPPPPHRSLARVLYTTFGGVRIVIATDDMESARAALA
jgi:hypothetical protein